jgi:hypothetical protein
MSVTPAGNKEQERMMILSVVENFFRYVHLHEAKEMLNEVKDQLLHKSYSHMPGTVPYDNTVYFFEKLEELLSAVHSLHRKNS